MTSRSIESGTSKAHSPGLQLNGCTFWLAALLCNQMVAISFHAEGEDKLGGNS